MSYDNLKIVKSKKASDFYSMLKALFPVGKIWNQVNDALVSLVEVFAEELNRFDTDVVKLQNECVPGLSEELIAEWEKLVLNSDEYLDVGATLMQRQANIQEKYTAYYESPTGIFFINYAKKAFNIDIAISYYQIFRCNMKCNLKLWGTDYGYVMVIHYPSGTDITKLTIALRRLAPAHILFDFVGDLSNLIIQEAYSSGRTIQEVYEDTTRYYEVV